MTDNELKEHCLQKAGIDLGRYSYNELNLIKDALRRYHNAKLKLLSISDVVGIIEQLPNITLEQAISKAKPNLDKITDVDKFLDDIR